MVTVKFHFATLISLTVVAMLLLVACTGNPPEPTPTPVPTPTDTPAPTDTPIPTPPPTATASSFVEYLSVCGELSDHVGEPATYGEFSESVAGIIDTMSPVNPPAEVADWHNLNLEIAHALKPLVDAQPEGEEIGLEFFALAAEFSDLQQRLEVAEEELSVEVRRQMVEAGCLEDIGDDATAATVPPTAVPTLAPPAPEVPKIATSVPTYTPIPTDTPTPTPSPSDTLAPTDTPTPAPVPTDAPTPAPTPAADDTPTPSVDAGVETYARECGQATASFVEVMAMVESEEAGEDLSWEELATLLDSASRAYSNLQPPPELQEYHDAQLRALSGFSEFALTRIGSESFSEEFALAFTELFAVVFEVAFDAEKTEAEAETLINEAFEEVFAAIFGPTFLEALSDLEEIESQLSKDVLAVLDAYGCRFAGSEDSGSEPEDQDSAGARGVATVTPAATASVGEDAHGNDLESATSIAAGDSIEGAIDYDDDVDVFVFEAVAGEIYEMDFELGSLQAAGWRLSDADGQHVEGGPFWKIQSSGRYYMEIRGNGSGSYSLTISLSDIVDDHGDNIDDASAVAVGHSVEGSLYSGSDVDWFSFESEAGELYEIDVSLGSLSNSSLALYGADGEYLGRKENRGANTRMLREAPETGRIYVEVSAYGPGGSYTLTISESDIVDDHGNDLERATSIAVGEAVQSEIDYDGDIDWFSFEAVAGEFYEIDVSLGGLGNSWVELFDSDGRPIATDGGIEWKAPNSASYYVEMSGGGTGSYTMTISVSGSADDNAINPDGASVLSNGESFAGSIGEGDVDWFSFDAIAGKSYTLDLSLGTLGYSYMLLYDPDNQLLTLLNNEGRYWWTASQSGAHYIELQGDGDVGTYTLTVSGDQHGNTPDDAIVVAVGETIQGALDFEGDGDVFAFDAEAGETYQFDVTLGTLVSNDLSVFSSDRGWTRLEEPIWEAMRSEEAYLAVWSSDGNTGKYTLTVALSETQELVQLTDNTGSDSDPSWSPDGNKIAFSSDRDGDWEIYVMDADGSDIVQLTDNSSTDSDPSWSPDGSKIAFASDRDRDFEIYVMEADGSGVIQLTDNSDGDGNPAWSSDGSRIVFSSNRDGDFEISMMNTDGFGYVQLTANHDDDLEPSWSPVGNKIAFASYRDGDLEIYVTDGSDTTQLTENTGVDGHPSWSPDGSKIAFLSDRDGDFEIYIMEADGSGITQLTDNSDGDVLPSWSPDGSKIAFVSDRDGDWEIYVMDVGSHSTSSGTMAVPTNKTQELVQLTDNSGSDYASSWSPDGRKIVFVSDQSGGRGLHVMEADGSGVTLLPTGHNVTWDPAWSPDGSKIAFVSDSDGDREIYVMNSDGSGIVQLTDNSESDTWPKWSSDGSRIAFESDRDGDWEVYVMNADGSGVVQLTDNSESDLSPSWSPDGSLIAFSSDRDGDWEIYVMNADGSGVAQLTDNTDGDGTPAWSPDGRRIAFESDRDGDWEIYVMSTDGSSIVQLTDNSDGDIYPSWSPDGSKIAFVSDRDGDWEIYVTDVGG